MIKHQIELARDFKQLTSELRQNMDKALLPLGITSAQYSMLSILSEDPNISGADLARKCKVTPQTIHKMIVFSENEGWIKRERHPSNDKNLFTTLSARGRRLLSKARPARLDVIKVMFKGFSSSEVQAFQRLMDKACKNLAK
ncbi:MAG: MarR family transcriptional regulator [Bdellovibrionales bacterium]|nr:MarR family transcriptional regulator [Bdellovibrionales bacterium]